jgi:hypothetical protein
MKPGPELDALIAEHIMGWKKIPIDSRGLTWMWDHKEACMWPDVQDCPQYSIDNNLAFKVAKEMGGVLTVTENLRQPGTDKLAWEAWFDPCEQDWAVGENPAHAICLSALLIKGIIKTDTVQSYDIISD